MWKHSTSTSLAGLTYVIQLHFATIMTTETAYNILMKDGCLTLLSFLGYSSSITFNVYQKRLQLIVLRVHSVKIVSNLL